MGFFYFFFIYYVLKIFLTVRKEIKENTQRINELKIDTTITIPYNSYFLPEKIKIEIKYLKKKLIKTAFFQITKKKNIKINMPTNKQKQQKLSINYYYCFKNILFC